MYFHVWILSVILLGCVWVATIVIECFEISAQKRQTSDVHQMHH